MANICFICEKEIEKGYKVKDSFVLETIRKIKQKFKILKNNQLYVCENCLENYKKRRANFERNNKINLAILIIITIIMFLIPLINGLDISIGSIISNIILLIILAAVLGLLSIFTYVPAIEKEISLVQTTSGAISQQQKSQTIAQTNAIVPLANQPNAIQPISLAQKANEIEQEIKTGIESAKTKKIKKPAKKKIKRKTASKNKIKPTKKLTKKLKRKLKKKK
jgi:hypothetical protein